MKSTSTVRNWLMVGLVTAGSAAAIYVGWLLLPGQHSGVNSVSNRSDQRAIPGFRTNASKSEINLKDILDGGPGKDGIPALVNPKFLPGNKAELPDDVRGILVERAGERKFYPYSILIWHEIVNDDVGSEPLAITFCPLCGSAIVFDRRVQGQTLTFKVSGKLFESNLLMYDTATESLWSQARGRAVVGDFVGTDLTVVNMQVLDWRDVPDRSTLLVLSPVTGHQRNYGFNPYGDYDENEELLFPVSVQDRRFALKELMYVIRVGPHSVATPFQELLNRPVREMVAGQQVEIERTTSGTTVLIDGQPTPGYVEMWFSWAAHHQADGMVIPST